MSAIASQPLHAPAEPFGQTGVRQYLGAFFALVCAAGVALCLSLWFRSHDVQDVIDIYHQNGRTILSSSYGRLRLAHVSTRNESEWAWAYNTRPMVRPRTDPWESSIWKLVGVEFRGQSVDRTGTAGWWLRVKWPTMALLLSAWPIMHVLMQMRRPKATAGFEVAPQFCGRCGRPATGTERCTCCGRDLLNDASFYSLAGGRSASGG